MERRITDELHYLTQVLPVHISQKLDELGRSDELLEIVLDLGRIPTARFINGEVPLAETEVTRADLDAVEAGVGSFDADNRAGMERTLHRISAIRNRRSEIVGLTCRVGRAVYGTIDIIQDLIESGQSILMMGAPGVGKTTMLREAARVLAETKRVVIVDTSNEIGGDGDVPHPAVGKARRMQVSHPERQHEVMIEAVENHNPEVIVIDEIGRELEAMAARTIAERGVQLIGTAHGNALDNLMLNPTLSDLVGGIGAVTLSDEEARRRGTQKTVLERRAPPTFDVLIELQTRDRMAVHEDVSAAVDAILRERPLPVEVRYRDAQGEMHVEMAQPELRMLNERNERNRGDGGYRGGRDSRRGNGREGGRERDRDRDRGEGDRRGREPRDSFNGGGYSNGGASSGNGSTGQVAPVAHAANSRGETERAPRQREGSEDDRPPAKLYAFGVARNRLLQAAKRLHINMMIVDDPGQADVILTLKNYYRRRPKLIVDAERAGRGIYVLRANTVSQMENFFMDVFQKEGAGSSEEEDPFSGAMRETREAIMLVRTGSTSYFDLAPQSNPIRRRQHELAQRADLDSHSFGSEPERFVRIMRRA
ncbi:MAG: AAA family ATPase [Pleurocapsa minor GSE-CHR-MK-17-07R]|jgi:stage III sporulation protein SpoIIIAA|nr:AAA family ATPase [Pleurocapsa minor GSE-CHR-MK 17-07R]